MVVNKFNSMITMLASSFLLVTNFTQKKSGKTVGRSAHFGVGSVLQSSLVIMDLWVPARQSIKTGVQFNETSS